MLNRLKVMGGPTLIYTPLGTKLKEASIKVSMCAPTKEASNSFLTNNEVKIY